MTCAVEYNAFSESQLISMPAGTSPTSSQLPHACNEHILAKEGVVIVCETAASSAVTWDEQQAAEPSEEAAEYGEYSRASYAESDSNRYLQTMPKPWWESQLAEGIHNTLKSREGMLATIQLSSPQLSKRFSYSFI